MTTLKFSSFESSADVSFWHALSQAKLNEFQLRDEPVDIYGFTQYGNRPNIPTRMTLSRNSFKKTATEAKQGRDILCKGTLVNTNTIDAFNTFDLASFSETLIRQLSENISSDAALTDNTLLNTFGIITFADLKKYRYHYWFCFPAIKLSVPLLKPAAPAESIFSFSQLESILQTFTDMTENDPTITCFLSHLPVSSEDGVEIMKLSELSTALKSDKQLVLGFADPCSQAQYPGWPLRNIIALLACKGAAGKKVTIVSWRPRILSSVPHFQNCVSFEVEIPQFELPSEGLPAFVRAWEKDPRGRLMPRSLDLSSTMDPEKLAAEAVDLNLKLMRWRLMPEINLEMVSQTKCLLLGAGTLGCNVARCLLGWGVRTITFIDNGKVSFSNPVRQTLYDFDDCKNGGQFKATAAAAHLKKIFPGVNSEGHVMTIPMPGHAASGENADQHLQNEVPKLESLIQSHDVVFLLLDTREARWLPTVMAANFRKLCLTAAVGFDSYVVMRHGVSVGEDQQQNLGCYFCNDATAPKDSTKDRTLDQQCTVSRPGLSMLCSSLVVELMVNTLHAPKGIESPHVTESDLPLGQVPQQIRGHVGDFSITPLEGQPFLQCTACCKAVREQYQSNRDKFLTRAFREAGYLEDLTGITELLKATYDDDLMVITDDELEDDDFIDLGKLSLKD